MPLERSIYIIKKLFISVVVVADGISECAQKEKNNHTNLERSLFVKSGLGVSNNGSNKHNNMYRHYFIPPAFV